MIKYIPYKVGTINEKFYDYIQLFGFHKNNNILIVPTSIQLNDPNNREMCMFFTQIINHYALQTFQFIFFQLSENKN